MLDVDGVVLGGDVPGCVLLEVLCELVVDGLVLGGDVPG